MHSSRMCTTHSSSCLLGGCLSQCMLGYPPRCGPGDPLGVGLETSPSGPGDPLGVGLETPRPYTSTLPPGVGLETPLARPLNFPWGVGLETCKACWDTHRDLQGMLGYHLQCMLGYQPPHGQNDRQV